MLVSPTGAYGPEESTNAQNTRSNAAACQWHVDTGDRFEPDFGAHAFAGLFAPGCCHRTTWPFGSCRGSLRERCTSGALMRVARVSFCAVRIPYFFDSSSSVNSSRIASTATCALNLGEWFFLFVILDRLSRHLTHLNKWSEIPRPPSLENSKFGLNSGFCNFNKTFKLFFVQKDDCKFWITYVYPIHIKFDI